MLLSSITISRIPPSTTPDTGLLSAQAPKPAPHRMNVSRIEPWPQLTAWCSARKPGYVPPSVRSPVLQKDQSTPHSHLGAERALQSSTGQAQHTSLPARGEPAPDLNGTASGDTISVVHPSRRDGIFQTRSVHCSFKRRSRSHCCR